MANETPEQAPIAELDFEPSAFEQAFQKHKSKIILVGILTGIGLLGFYTMKFWKEHRETQDGLAFFKAETVADYERVAKELAGRNAGGNALLMAAQVQAEEGKPEEAITKLQNFLKDYPNHPLADLATLRLADAQSLSGKVDESKATLTQVFEKFPTSPHAPLALLRLGDQLAAEKKTEEATKQYDILRSKYPGNAYFEAMTKHRDALTRKEPTPVEFVADPVPPPPTPGGPAGLPGLNGAPSTTLDIPSLNPTTPPTEKMPLEDPKLEIPATPAPVVPVPAVPDAAAPAAPEPATPAPAKP